MRIRKIVGWTAISIGILIVVCIAAVSVAMQLGLTINLEDIRSKVSAAATKAVGRDITIGGSVNWLFLSRPKR